MSYFFLTEYHHSWVNDTLYVVLTTDVACHLWLYWTADPMRVHNRTIDDRGLEKLADPDYCFVGWTRVEQNEPGDTYDHTFNFGPWAHCNWRWWVFRGEIAGNPTTSVSCIFTAHYETYIADESNRHIDLEDRDPNGYIDHAFYSIPGVKLSYPFGFPLFPTTPDAYPTTDFEVSNKAHVDATVATAIREYQQTYPWSFPSLASGAWLTWNLAAIVPDGARFVEIIHLNTDETAWLYGGSRKPSSALNRRRQLYPGSVFTWFTELSPDRKIEVYPETNMVKFNVLGYYT